MTCNHTSGIDTGGSAFPTPHLVTMNGEVVNHGATGGMTLRDWFAGRPMTEEEFRAVREEFWEAHQDQPVAKTSDIRYWYADRMIAEKRRSEGGAA